jgi:hypothetical protein
MQSVLFCVYSLNEKRNAYRLLVGKPEGKRPLGRPRRRWVDNIRMDLGEFGWGDVVRVPGFRSRDPGSIPGDTKFSEKWWVWNGVHSAS